MTHSIWVSKLFFGSDGNVIMLGMYVGLKMFELSIFSDEISNHNQ